MTLIEVVIALLLFALMSTVLLIGQATAVRSIEKSDAMRDMSELLGFRLQMVLLQLSEYEDGDTGEFPASGISKRLIDEEDVFDDRYEGYTWEVSILETVGAGASGSVSIEGEDPASSLFAEEGGATGDDFSDDDVEEVEADSVDRMLMITVTVYPPGWEEADAEDEDAIQPRSVWTAVKVPEDPNEEGAEGP
ncbi:MAG: type II secretion system protein [Planctomycetota bacterium]